MNSHLNIREKYNRVAPVYDFRWWGYVEPTINYLLTRLQLEGDEQVLDVSCGTGELMKRLLESYSNIDLTGLDVSRGMLDEARRKVSQNSNVELHQGRAEDLPFPDASFDVIVSTSSFHYYDPPETALREFRRVLRPDGRLYLLDWDRTHWLWQVLHPVLKRFDAAYKQCYTPNTTHSMLVDSGFSGIKIESVRLWWIWGVWFSSATFDPAI